ncbi:MAG: HDOD domain-containing protein, partial [Blastopirellula sp. JB062]
SIDAVEVKRCIERDPALTVKILRAVNSPLFGLSRQVSDLHQALALLGMKPLELLVLGFSLPREMLNGVEADSLRQYWTIALSKGVAAREIALFFGLRSGDEAFIAGILADVGMLVLLQDLGAPYAHFVRKTSEEGASLLEMEVSTIGFDHVVLSSRLLTQWGLPPTLIDAIAAIKPLPDSAPLVIEHLPETAKSLVLADRLVEVLAGKRLAALPAWIDAAAQMGSTDLDELRALAARVEEKTKQLSEVMRVSVEEQTSYADVMLQAYGRLSAASAEASLQITDDGSEEYELYKAWREAKDLSSAMQTFRQRPLDAPVATRPEVRSQAVAVSMNQKSPRNEPSVDSASIVRLDAEVQRCRQLRQPVSVLQIGLDRYDDLLLLMGPDELAHAWQLFEKAIDAILGDVGSCFVSSDAVITAIMPGQDRMQAVATARRLTTGIRVWAQTRAETIGTAPLTISVGAAAIGLPPKNFRSNELTDAAMRCMEVARRSGGDSVKSIEIL